MASSLASMSESERQVCKVIALIDMDSFECQIYKRLYPNVIFWGEPWVVVDQTGRIVSATHEARELGISRKIRLPEAKRLARQKKVPIKVFTKPNDREKPDAKEVRYATWDILDALKEYAKKYCEGMIIEYSSSDEFYLDITTEVNLRLNDDRFSSIVESRTFLETECEKMDGESLGLAMDSRYRCQDSEQLEQERRLVYGGLLMQEVNNFLFRQTKLIGSVGVGTNKLMAKLAVSLNKPNGITILPDNALSRIGNDIPIEKIPGFGGTFGGSVKNLLSISTMNELASIELEPLEDLFGQEKAIDMYFKSRGISDEAVKYKLMNDKVSCGKNFHGQITSDETLHYHMHQLVEELLERLAEERERHKRQPTFIKVELTYDSKESGADCEKKFWRFHSNYEYQKTCQLYCKKAMQSILKDEDFNIDAVKVARIEVRAYTFKKLKEQ